MAYLTQLAIAVDQVGNALLGGWADESISSRAHRQQHKRRWAIARALIDAVFFWDRDHCAGAFKAENERRQLPPAFRDAGMG